MFTALPRSPPNVRASYRYLRQILRKFWSETELARFDSETPNGMSALAWNALKAGYFPPDGLFGTIA
jgi:hypothetical protein